MTRESNSPQETDMQNLSKNKDKMKDESAIDLEPHVMPMESSHHTDTLNICDENLDMEDVKIIDLEQRKPFVSTQEFNEKVLNFQNRFKSNEKVSSIRFMILVILGLLVLALIGAFAYMWHRQDSIKRRLDCIERRRNCGKGYNSRRCRYNCY